MTDYLTLTEFVPGTKAKAQEINENFSLIKDAINSKAPSQGDSLQTFSVAEATADAHAVSKGQFDDLAVNIEGEIKKTRAKFCARSGNVTSGKGDLFSYSGLVITPKIGGSYANLVIADYTGAQATINSAATLSMSGKADGKYNIFITSGGTLYVLKNTIYRQASRPTMVDGDVWLNTSVVPFMCIKYSGAADVEFLDVPLGAVTIASGAITALTTNKFNHDGYSVCKTNDAVVVDSYVNGASWYKIWSDGWIEQGGSITTNAATQLTTVTFLKAFSNTNYTASACPDKTTNFATGIFSALANITATTMDVSCGSSGSLFTMPVKWYACGY